MKNSKFIKYIKDILPGLLVSVAVALVGMFMAKFLPKLGAGTISIFLGMFVGVALCDRPGLSLNSI